MGFSMGVVLFIITMITLIVYAIVFKDKED